MTKFSKQISMGCFSTIVFLIFTVSAFANSNNEFTKTNVKYSDEQLRKQIEEELLQDYAEGLDEKKSDFNVNDQSFKSAKLGNGIAYYHLTQDYFENGNEDEIAKLQGYLFPVKVNGKVVASVFAELFEGRWSIFKISSNADLEEKANNIKRLLKDSESASLVLDERFGLYALLAKDSDNSKRFLSIRDNLSGDLVEGKEKSTKEFYLSIKNNSHNNHNADKKGGATTVPTFSNDTERSNLKQTTLFSALAALSCLSLGVFLYRKKSKTK